MKEANEDSGAYTRPERNFPFPPGQQRSEMKLPVNIVSSAAKSDPVLSTPVKPFSDAVKNFRSKVGKFSINKGIGVATKVRVTKWRGPFTQPKPKKTTVERTASFSHLEIVQEPSEDDMQPGNVLYQAQKNLGAGDVSLQGGKGLRKNSSQTSLLSMSSMNSSMSKGFWPTNQLNRSKRSSFNSQIDFVRYAKKSSRYMFPGQNSHFQKRRAKQNLERDMRWNGPYDENFFRTLEGHLDQAIAKLVCQSESLVINVSKGDSSKTSSDI